jgi:hypothetical protein
MGVNLVPQRLSEYYPEAGIDLRAVPENGQ